MRTKWQLMRTRHPKGHPHGQRSEICPDTQLRYDPVGFRRCCGAGCYSVCRTVCACDGLICLDRGAVSYSALSHRAEVPLSQACTSGCPPDVGMTVPRSDFLRRHPTRMRGVFLCGGFGGVDSGKRGVKCQQDRRMAVFVVFRRFQNSKVSERGRRDRSAGFEHRSQLVAT